MERTMVRGGVIGGLALATLGSLLLLQPIVGLNIWAFSWPYFVVVPGLVMLFSAFRWAPHTAGLAIPGSLLTVTGLLLFYQNVFGYFQSWAYAWALVCPTALGIGFILCGRLVHLPVLHRLGQIFATIGLFLFLGLAACFEVGVFRHGGLVRIGLPLLLLFAGLGVSLGSLARSRTLQQWVD